MRCCWAQVFQFITNSYILITIHAATMAIPKFFSHHPSISSITSGRSSRLHPMSVQSCCRLVLAGRPTITRPWEGVQRRRSLMSSSLRLQQCPTCLVRLNWMVFEMCGRWPYNCCFVGCCFQDLFYIARSILLQMLSNFFSIRFVNIPVVYPYRRFGGARGVMFIVVGNGHGDTSSNPARDWLHFA